MSSRTYLAFASVLSGVLVVNACSSDSADTPNTAGTSSSGGSDGGGGGDATASSSGGTSSSGGSTSSGESGVSCKGLDANCGGSNDCCAAKPVPGGTFNRSNDEAFPATISDFQLDVYEVTVGRFRAFVEAGQGTQMSPPAAGAGAHPKIANSGWDAAFNAELAADTAALKSALACNPETPAWTDAAGANENKPINCITWFDALAFCAWDGGRLPTEAEWNYAAAGGSEQRIYPAGGDTIDATRASFDCTDGKTCLLTVGSKSPAGDGKYGHADLAGNVWEWTLDYKADPYAATCTDCAELTVSEHRTFRGGGFPNEASYLTTDIRLDDVPTDRDHDVGVRCARAMK